MIHILLVEDDKNISITIFYYLQSKCRTDKRTL